jgi:tRNA (guanine37-N1)-methyltransferase
MNLREEHEPYKVLIATVILDKLSRVRTVVNKTKSHGGPYRTFAMEVLAGDPELETSLRENGCTFTLDYSKVYWNSRLETEHRRIVDSLSPDDVLADAFCGIGPFALPAVKLRKCKVYANDLNPSSIEYLKSNAAKNGVSMNLGSRFVPSCECARTFLTRIVRIDNVPITRVVMNFPSGAPEFLDVFSGLYAGLEEKKLPMPTVNCYCFARGDEWHDDAKQRVRAVLGIPADDIEIPMIVREVRDVAPKKRHVCVTFQIPKSVAYRTRAEVTEVAGIDATSAQKGEETHHDDCTTSPIEGDPKPKRQRVELGKQK